jgi:hypothetical protein
LLGQHINKKVLHQQMMPKLLAAHDNGKVQDHTCCVQQREGMSLLHHHFGKVTP